MKEIKMPGPDPNAVWFEEYEGRLLAIYEPYFWSGNVENRAKRATAILRRKVRRDWFCRWCGDELQDWRRADAKYCGAGCKRKAARFRRKNKTPGHLQ